MKVAIIGGGLTGLALAHRLRRDHQVSVFERETQLGGLATYHDYGKFYWDRFYHVVLPSDRHLIRFIADLGLADKLRWRRTLTGFFVDRELHSMSSGFEFLRFRPVNLWGKLRLAFTILYCSRINNWRKLEKIHVGEWLRKLSGRATYDKIWKPMLLAKLGDDHARVSAVFIWSYIKRMFSARDRSTQKEQLGHVSGGYKTVFDTLERSIVQAGGRLRTGVTVRRIAPRGEGGLWLEHGTQREHFDKVIFTSPVDALKRVANEGLVRVENRGDQVEYLGVICMVLVTREPLVPYYVVNIADPRIPFTGIIGMSNLVDTAETAGLHVTFLPKYVHSDSPMLNQSDAELQSVFFSGLRTMFPDWEKRGVESVHINRARRVQPLQVLNYSEIVPKATSEHPDFFVLNTSQFTHMTLNNNEVVRAVDEFLAQHGPALKHSARRHIPAPVAAPQAQAQAV